MLQPSIPDDCVPEAGTVRLNIRPTIDGGQLKVQWHNKALYTTPDVKIRPPEGIYVVTLDSVYFTMAFLESSQCTKVTNKRQKTDLNNSLSLSSTPESCENINKETGDVLLYEDTDLATATLGHEKRKRPGADSYLKAKLSQTLFDQGPGTMHCSSAKLSPSRPKASWSSYGLDQEAIEQMINGGFRLAVNGVLGNKYLFGLKVKANTFRLGLADIAPALWRPGYLDVGCTWSVILMMLTLS